MSSKPSTSAGMIYLVCHCSTANSERNYPLLLGREVPQQLSEKGKKQAQILGEHFAKRDISAIYTSPTSAAVQTARAIRSSYAVPMTFCTSLTEANFGTWEGLSMEQAARTAQHAAFLAGEGFPEGETFKQICKRTIKYIEQLAITHKSERIVVVSHDTVIRVVLCHLCGVPFDRLREIDQAPGCANLIRVFHGKLELRSVNNDNLAMADTIEQEKETVEC